MGRSEGDWQIRVAVAVGAADVVLLARECRELKRVTIVHEVVGLDGDAAALVVGGEVVAEHRLRPRQEQQVVLLLRREALILRKLPRIVRVVEGVRENQRTVVLLVQRRALAPVVAVVGAIDIQAGAHAGVGDAVVGEAGVPGFLADVVGHAGGIEGDDVAEGQLYVQVVRRRERELAGDRFGGPLAVLHGVAGGGGGDVVASSRPGPCCLRIRHSA